MAANLCCNGHNQRKLQQQQPLTGTNARHRMEFIRCTQTIMGSANIQQISNSDHFPKRSSPSDFTGLGPPKRLGTGTDSAVPMARVVCLSLVSKQFSAPKMAVEVESGFLVAASKVTETSDAGAQSLPGKKSMPVPHQQQSRHNFFREHLC